MRFGQYQIRRKLGSGGMGVVYEGEHQILHRRAAIKVLRASAALDAEVTQRFYEEARTAAKLTHPGIVQIYDVGIEPPDTPYLAMELLRGQSLAQRLKQANKASERLLLLPLLLQVAEALAYAHGMGVIHRDIKPENVFVCTGAAVPGGEQAKLVDFGLAKQIRAKDIADWTQTGPGSTSRRRGVSFDELTKTGMGLGTPLFMPPEQWIDAKRADDKADAYSFGVMLYEVLSGRLPFHASIVADLLELHLRDAPPPLQSDIPGLPSDLVALVDSLLAKDPASRPSMRVVAERLAQALASLPKQATTQPSPAPQTSAEPNIDVLAETPRAITGADLTPRFTTDKQPEPDPPLPVVDAHADKKAEISKLPAVHRGPARYPQPSSDPIVEQQQPRSRWQAADAIPLAVMGLALPLLFVGFVLVPAQSDLPSPSQTAPSPPTQPQPTNRIEGTKNSATPAPDPDNAPPDPTQNVGRAILSPDLHRMININQPLWRKIKIPSVLAVRIPACTHFSGEYQICLSESGTVASVEPSVSVPWADRAVADSLKTGTYTSSPAYNPGHCTRERILFQIDNHTRSCLAFKPIFDEPVLIEEEGLSENKMGGIYMPPERPKRISPSADCANAVAQYELIIDRGGHVSDVIPTPGLRDRQSDREARQQIQKWRYRALAFPVRLRLAVSFQRRADDPPCVP